MKKALLGGFILLDMGLIGGSSFVLYTYVRGHLPMTVPVTAFSTVQRTPLTAPAQVNQVAASSSAVKAAAGTLPTPAAAVTESSTRKILFTYRNPHAKQVSIRADFTGWKAEIMQKAANGSWTYQATLSPGEYAYCFTADDKTFKDPANKRTKQIGRTLVSAILVESLPSKTLK